jgi:nucleotide-binding universal stress UspA family protein
MLRFKNILVQITRDDSCQEALGRAVKLARRSGAALTLASVVEDFPWYTRFLSSGSAELNALLLKRRSETIEALAAPIRAEGISITTKVLRGRPSLEVVREVIRGGYDLVVKDAEPGGGLIFPSRNMELVRTCPCPVWLVRPPRQGRSFERILAAVDPAPAVGDGDDDPLNFRVEERSPASLDHLILDLATGLAELEGAELHVLHAWNAPGEDLLRGDPRVPASTLDDYVESLRLEAQVALEVLVSGHPFDPARRFLHLRKGQPAEVITQFVAEQKIDLITMGGVVRTGLPGLLIGNTAEAVLERISCSALTVKPPGFVSPVAREAAEPERAGPKDTATGDR